MADGRLFLRCKRCGEQLLLLKNYENYDQSWCYVPPARDTIQAYLFAHITGLDCLPEAKVEVALDPQGLEFVEETAEHWAGPIPRWEARHREEK